MNNKVKVLYIEDDKFIKKMIEISSKDYPEFQIDFCDSIANLIQICQKYDIIISDNYIKDGNIDDTLNIIKSNNYLNQLPI